MVKPRFRTVPKECRSSHPRIPRRIRRTRRFRIPYRNNLECKFHRLPENRSRYNPCLTRSSSNQPLGRYRRIRRHRSIRSFPSRAYPRDGGELEFRNRCNPYPDHNRRTYFLRRHHRIRHHRNIRRFRNRVYRLTHFGLLPHLILIRGLRLLGCPRSFLRSNPHPNHCQCLNHWNRQKPKISVRKPDFFFSFAEFSGSRTSAQTEKIHFYFQLSR